MRCCRAWKLPIGTPNCLRVRRYFGRERQQAVAHDAFEQRATLAFGTEQRVGADLHAREAELGRMAAVDAAIAARADAGRVARHEEQRDAGLVVHGARRARAHQQQLRLVAERHHGLGAVDAPAVAASHRGGGDAAQLVMVGRLVVRQRRQRGAGNDVFEPRLLRRRAGLGQRAAHEQRAQQRLGHQVVAQGLEHQVDVGAGAAQAAVGLLEQRADGADLGQLGIGLGAVAGFAIGRLVAVFRRVLLAQVAVQSVRQHAAVFVVFKVHACPRTAPGSSWR